ncbi:hypothetical protein ID866_4167 [Astraeus odoratus]|nr:hypothetical protein ID866_4167 [Astraeus odoratus]
MKAWLHFGKGDYFLFQTWTPSSDGAIAGVSIAIFAFCIMDRWLAAFRRAQEYHWRAKALALVMKHQSRAPVIGGAKLHGHADCIEEVSSAGPRRRKGASRPAPRLIPPFIPSHDIIRGMMHVIQSAFTYALMLVVMTFNAAYIIAIILGLGVGEVLFGRMGHNQDGSTTH